MSFDNHGSAVGGASGSGNSGMQSSAISLCKSGCGFFANTAYEGMCSKCYKDFIVQREPNLPTVGRSTDSNLAVPTSSSEESVNNSLGLEIIIPAPSSIQTGPQTILNINERQEENILPDHPEAICSFPSTSADIDSSVAKPKRIRCLTCKKKVGLLGFPCRCGGLFCSTHRYSDMHSCEFDYKEHGQDLIRKSNPVVAGEKVIKL